MAAHLQGVGRDMLVVTPAVPAQGGNQGDAEYTGEQESQEATLGPKGCRGLEIPRGPGGQSFSISLWALDRSSRWEPIVPTGDPRFQEHQGPWWLLAPQVYQDDSSHSLGSFQARTQGTGQGA